MDDNADQSLETGFTEIDELIQKLLDMRKEQDTIFCD